MADLPISAPVAVPELSPLLTAMEENLHGHIAFLQQDHPAMKVEDRDDLLLVDSGLPTETYNKIARARLTEMDADRRIAEAIEHFRSAGRPFAWWVGPGSRPLDLEQRLREHGLKASEYELGMAMELAGLPERVSIPAGLRVRRVRAAPDLAAFASVAASEPRDPSVAAFLEGSTHILLREDCPMRLFVGYVDGQPAGISELFIGGGVAGIHSIATRSRFQRRGIGMAMTWTALTEGRELGLVTATLQAATAGHPLYQRLGFRACCKFVEYR